MVGERFAELHRQEGVFVMANAWDAGTARLLTEAGFPALGTTSAGLAHALGRPDGANAVSREETLANAAAIAAATHLPVSADLESGFGATPEEVARTIRLAASAGLAGGSVEDSTGRAEDPVRPLAEAVERVAAAAEAARSLETPFVLTARAENFLHGRPDLADTVRRLRAYAEAGADVLFAPGLPDADAVRMVVTAVDRPVNVLAGGAGPRLTVAELGALGVRRISVGSALSRTALAAAHAAARRILTDGTFDFGDVPSVREVNATLVGQVTAG
ncbi:isocitrate lyase/phosphoenolpyruvate mutase family protein [Streptomyces sp. TRM70308]|uniref:isocitrate lyase/PEP mutase family protein n=1 Tax=Streptomyces sp. TRM70308 TaxID=3131932 RepID=UPI003D07CF8B